MSDLHAIDRTLANVQSMLIGLSRRQSGRKPPIRPQLVRGIAIRAAAEVRQVASAEIVRQFYRDDATIRTIAEDVPGWHLKAVTNPAATTTPGWAAELVDGANYPGLLPALSPTSVFSQLRPRSLSISLGRNGYIRLIGRERPASIPSIFIAEGAPIPVRSLQLAVGPLLQPFKTGCMAVYSSELAKRSIPAFESVLSRSIDEDLAMQLDDALLSNNPAVPGVSPPGLLAGITPLTASAATDAAGAAYEDVRALASAFSPPASDPVLIVSTPQAVSLSMLYPDLRLPVIVSTVLPAGRVIMLDASDLATITSEDGEAHYDQQALVQMRDDPSSADILLAGPDMSMWQSDMRNLRILESLGWAMRRSGRVQYLDAVQW